MAATAIIEDLAKRARLAARTLANSSNADRNQILMNISLQLRSNLNLILQANQVDMEAAKKSGMNNSLQDRLLLTEARILSIANAAENITKLPDPLNRVLAERTLDNGLHLLQKSVPFGVVGMVYEARPNVTVDAAVILLKSGNAALLRGSSSAEQSNKILIEVMKKAFAGTAISPEVLQLVPSDDRSTVTALLKAKGLVDLVIPRGSAQLIRTVVDEATVPTIETGAGVCHVYVDKSADLEKALSILINSKCDRPSVCNAAETLLVDKKIADKFLPLALKKLYALELAETGSLGRALNLAGYFAKPNQAAKKPIQTTKPELAEFVKEQRPNDPEPIVWDVSDMAKEFGAEIIDEIPLCAQGCGPMVLKQGTKEGKEYRGWVCPRPKSGHPAKWMKIGSDGKWAFQR